MTRRLSRLDVDPALQQRRTAADHVADSLRAAIINGQFEDGQELNQVELARHYGVSRVPVREALRRLQAEGLVEAEAHRSAVVTGLTGDRILEIFELRELLEARLLERSAAELCQDDLDALEALCERMDKLNDHDRWIAANNDFHRALYSRARCEVTQDLLDQVTARVQRYASPGGGFDRAAAAGREHRRIVAALQRGQIEQARAELVKHIHATRDRVMALLQTSEARRPNR